MHTAFSTKTPILAGILWKIMRRIFFQAISDISEPALGRHHDFSWKCGHFEPYKQSPKTLDLSKNVYFSWSFSEVMNKTLVFPGIFL